MTLIPLVKSLLEKKGEEVTVIGRGKETKLDQSIVTTGGNVTGRVTQAP